MNLPLNVTIDRAGKLKPGDFVQIVATVEQVPEDVTRVRIRIQESGLDLTFWAYRENLLVLKARPV